MKLKSLIILLLLILLCGCGKKQIECIYKNEKDENMKSYMRVTLVYEDELIKSEKLYAVYQFKDEESASKNYSTIEKILEQDSSVNLEQMDERIVAQGEKDITSMQYDKKTKVAYYEQLGYTCK